jgi:site-specific recombinase XerD
MPSHEAVQTWEEPVREFLLHYKATRSANTHAYYAARLSTLTAWAGEEGVAFGEFSRRHLDRYVIARREAGRKPTTVQHAAATTCTLFAWCAKNDLLDRDPLAGVKVKNAPKPPRRMPSDEDVRRFVAALGEYWDPRKNPNVRSMTTEGRSFHRVRNTAIYLGLISTACRVGELLDANLEDYVPGERRILLRETKGREPRTVPVSAQFEDALAAWLRKRRRIMGDQPDCGKLFVTETGVAMAANKFIRTIGPVSEFAGCATRLQTHDLRRYGLNKYARVNLLAAQEIAGHKDARTTHGYTKLDPEWLREMVDEVDVLGKVVVSKRERRRRIV